MACVGGCIAGAGCLTHGEKDRDQVDAYGREALEKTIKDATSVLRRVKETSPQLACRGDVSFREC